MLDGKSLVTGILKCSCTRAVSSLVALVAHCSRVIICQTNHLAGKTAWEKTCHLFPLAACCCSSALPVQRFVGLLQTRWPKCFRLQSSFAVSMARLRDSEQQCQYRAEREHFQLIFHRKCNVEPYPLAEGNFNTGLVHQRLVL